MRLHGNSHALEQGQPEIAERRFRVGQHEVVAEFDPGPAAVTIASRPMSLSIVAAAACIASQQDLAPDDLKWEDSFTPTPMPQPGVTKFV